MKRRVWLPEFVLCVFVVVSCLMVSSMAIGQTPKAKSGPMAKVGTDLAALADAYETSQLQSSQTIVSRPFKFQKSLLRIINGRVIIDAVASGDVQALRADLEALGMQKGRTYGRWVSGQLPITAIKALATLGSLKFARPAYMKTNAGLVTSQGDAAMRTDDARTAFGVDGSGVKVGALSDSFNCQGGAAADIASGDLPPDVMVLDDTACPGSDEGRALLQIIHDVAPGASLAFHTAFNGMADFAQGIHDLANVGAKVIVDDVIYFAEPMFQDGPIAQAVDTVKKDMDVAYFSAAGNDARKAYESGFRPDGVFPPGAFGPFSFLFFGGTAHDFDPGPGVDVFQQITVPVGSGFIISFQWDAPFFSICGDTDCPAGSPNDLDIYVLDSLATTVINNDGTFPNVGGDPVEIVAFFNNGSFDFNHDGVPDTKFNIMIMNFDGPDPGLIKYVRFDFGPGVVINEFDTASGTIYGHANAAGAMAVGAAFYGNTPEFGINPALLEPFSSAGRTRILFTTDGTSTLDLRQKPEFVAPDGVNTTFFGCCDVEPDGVPNFFGTSASTPHAAGVAALMLQAKPSLSPDQIRMTLQDTALDMGTPGVDDDSGYGLISAFAAVEAVVNDVITLMPPDATNEVGQEHTVTATLTDGLGTPQPGVRVTFSVFDGPNVGITSNTDGLCSPNADCTTDANGEVSFTYLGIGGVGTDHIHACFVNQFEEEVCSSVVTMEWTAAVVRSCPDVPPAPAEVPLGYTLKVGSDGNDVLFGTPGNDMIFGLGGNDRILGLGGDDILCGGPGNDTIYGGDGKDFIDGGPGNDSLYGESGDDTILGGDGDDRLYGQGGDDDLDGGRGNDEIYGGTGQDVLRGGEGDDRLSGQGGDDDLDGGAGNNRLDGGTGIDTCINGVRINCEG